MRKILVENIKEGMTLSKPIFTSTGIILLNEGTKLTARYVEKILSTGVQQIYIEDNLSEGIKVNDLIREETRFETKKILQESLGKFKAGYFNAGEGLIKKVELVVHEVLSQPKVMVSVQEMRSRSEYLHLHSINVCVISLLLAKRMNLSDLLLKHLALGALLHDCGKTTMKLDSSRYKMDYIDKEWDIYKQHAQNGYEMLQAIPGASMISANIVKQHHEKYDGTGFPLGLKGDNIHELARIVSVANEYDNLLYNLPPGEEMKHYEIIEFIVSKAYREFDPSIIKIFSETISPYPLGSGVVLSNGQSGIISKINAAFPTRPFVRIINEERSLIIEEIDLSKLPSLFIVDEKDIDK